MSKISEEFLSRALSEFNKYKGEKNVLNQRVRENDFWYKARYAKVIDPKSGDTSPATAFIFSAIETKYADAIDSFPACNILEREPSDADLSKILSKIIPVQLDLSDFKKAYKANWRRKLKHGTGIYGVFYDDDIIIKPISILNVYCDMHVQDVQDSQFLFIVNAVDNDELKKDYPKFRDKFSGSTSVETFDGTHEAADKTEIIDCYYKKDGKVHCMKLCANEIIEATEDGDYPDGLYRHGKYPVVFDVLYPEEDCPFGFGIIDIAKNPQMYIDKLDGAIIKNSVLASKLRYFITDNGAVDENELMDYSRDVIHVAGAVNNDTVKEFRVSPLSAEVTNHRNKKIDELKEIIGNRDFQQGGTNSGVTAASAITVLQEAGNKLSRTMIDDSYDAYKEICVMVIELMREFYDEKKIYRIVNDSGETEYSEFSNEMMFKEKQLPEQVSEEMRDILPEAWTETEPIELDVSVVPQKKNPFQREANNQTIMSLWSAGFFNPQSADMAIIALQAMNFDGRDNIISLIKEYQNKMQQAPQMPEQVQQGDELVPIEQGAEDFLSSEQQKGDELIPINQGIQEAENNGNYI